MVLSRDLKTEKPEPYRSRLARKVLHLYRLRRGKDRLYLVLRGVLNLPKFVKIKWVQDVEINLDLDDYLQRWMFCHRLEDDHDLATMGRILQPGDYFIDIGANIGIVTLIASSAIGESGKVYAIEALPETREKLLRNLAVNSITNVEVLPYAILNEDRVVEFFESTDGNIGGSSLSGSGKNAEAILVEGRSLDSLWKQGIMKRCDVLKMDIEGAEVLALKGMQEFLNHTRPRAVLTEISDELLSHFSCTPQEVIEYFRSLGYEWFKADPRGLKRMTDLKISGCINLWAILPGSVHTD